MKALAKLDTNGSWPILFDWQRNTQIGRPNWSRYLGSLFGLAEVEDGHSHRFRDTFAVELLLAGVPLEDVASFLGIRLKWWPSTTRLGCA